MKRGKSFILYFSGILFCCFFFAFFCSKVSAASVEYNYSCADTSVDYACLSMIKVDVANNEVVDNEYHFETMELPKAAGSLYIRSIESNVIKIYVNGEESSEVKLRIDTLILPNPQNDSSGLYYLRDNCFNNIASIGKVVIPTSIREIGQGIFNDAQVSEIYLNNSTWDNGGSNEEVNIESNSFNKDKVGKIICSDITVYTYYKGKMLSADSKLTIAYTFNFYKYEDKNNSANTFESKTYYATGISENGVVISVNDIPDADSVTNLNFLCWEISGIDSKTLEENATSVTLNTNPTTYNLYPTYELNEQTTTLTASATKINYGDGVIELTGNSCPTSFDCTYSWKFNNNSIDNSNGNYSVSEVKQSGKYSVTISYSYTYEEKEYSRDSTADATITINPRDLYVYFNNIPVTYGTNYDGKSPYSPIARVLGLTASDSENATLDLKTAYPSNASVGFYENAVKLGQGSTLKLKDNEDIDKLSNYNIITIPGNYTVNPLSIDVAYGDTENDQVEFVFGEKIDLGKEFTITGIYGDTEEKVNVKFLKEDGLNCGTYKIVGAVSENHNFTLNNVTSEDIDVTIVPKTIDKIYFDSDNLTYDQKEKSLKLYYSDVNNSKVYLDYSIIEYSNSRVTNVASPEVIKNAGDYKIEGELKDSNYKLSTDISIVRADDETITFTNSVIPGTGKIQVTFRVEKYQPSKGSGDLNYADSQIFTYTGGKIYPYIIINNADWESEFEKVSKPRLVCGRGNSSSEGENDCKDFNNVQYTIHVTYPETQNYKSLELTITEKIGKYPINITPKSFEFYLGESINAGEEISMNGDTIYVQYVVGADSSSAVGKYRITNALVNNSNYSISLNQNINLEKVIIKKRPVTIVYYNYEDLVYTGNDIYVGAYAVDNISGKLVNGLNLEVVVDEGVIKDAKTYHLHAHIESDEYYVENTSSLVVEVAKAKYDLSKIKLMDATYTLDFKKHGISIEGTLPTGLKVEYTIDGKEGNSTSSAFRHVVVAKFISDNPNYLETEELTATIYIDMSWIFITISMIIICAGIGFGGALLYIRYRREHPRKIKLKINQIINEDLAAKRVAKSVEEVLGDEKKEVEESLRNESEDDIIESQTDTFIERIYAADSEVKYYYSEVKNELLSYEGVSHSVDRKYEVFTHGTRQIAKISICNGVLRLYVNLDPDKYDKNQYNQRDMSGFECHARTPLRINVNTTESLRNAKIFIRILRKKENLRPISSFVRIDYEKFYTLKERIFPKMFKKLFSGNKGKK